MPVRMMFILFAVTIAPVSIMSSAFCQSELEQAMEKLKIRTIHANATSVDWVSSTLLVDYGGDQLLFSVSSDTRIMRGQEQIGLSDIDIADPLVIKYYDSESEPYQAISIVDSNLGNE
ncbi:MAG: hypothetical protein FJZ15_04760 [Candidatus Omnitrophica bacterium]|nr:hypothetical protein [Candidatus Omnitrophota bacterium]